MFSMRIPVLGFLLSWASGAGGLAKAAAVAVDCHLRGALAHRLALPPHLEIWRKRTAAPSRAILEELRAALHLYRWNSALNPAD